MQTGSNNTQRAYCADWDDFTGWCGRRGFQALPATPETVALYLAALDQAGRRASTLRRRLAGIRAMHAAAGLPNPTRHALVVDALAAIEEMQALEPDQPSAKAKAALAPADLRHMLRALPASLSGLRDRSLLLVGYHAGLRRSQLVGLDGEHLRLDAHGATFRLPDTRLLRIGRHDDSVACPVAATEAWLEAAAIDAGPLYRPIDRHGNVGDGRLSDRAVALIVKRAAENVGLDPDRFAGDSLVAGGRVTALLERGL